MGLQERSEGGTFVSIADGKIIQSFKEPAEGRRQKISKEGKVSYVKEYDSIYGIIAGLKLRKSTSPTFSDQYVMTIVDGNDVFNVSFYKSSRISASILKTMPNVDLSIPATISPWMMADKNDPLKKVQGVAIYQKGRGLDKDKVPPAHTKDNPNGLPQMVKIKVKGKEQWDSSDMDEFLESKALALFTTTNSNAATQEDQPF